MNLTKILSIVFLLVAIALGGYLYTRIDSKVQEERNITRIEAQVIQKLKMIRDAEVAYQAIHGRYTSDWDKLINFIDTGRIYIIQRKEIVIPGPYQRDSIVRQVDTLGTVSVKDSLFSDQKYPNFNPERLPYIPGAKDKKFEIFADEIVKGGVEVDVIEVRDVDPVNPARSEENEAFNRKPLRFGSRTEVTTSGNWE